MPPPATGRPRAYEDDAFPWHLGRLPKGCPDAAATSAVFVVHGMGAQAWTETGVSLRAGFEEAIEKIRAWQRAHPVAEGEAPDPGGELPPPFIHEGFWADYDDLGASFPGDWEIFTEEERTLYMGLWANRTSSAGDTFGWYVRKLLSLLDPRRIGALGPWNYLLYWPLALVGLAAFTWMLLRQRKLLTSVLGDVRLYAAPKGIVERAIVQRIDRRVGTGFLRLIGLDWDFRPLAETDQLKVGGQPRTFERVVWVAHSLGTVVSYNVLSDLFHRAGELEGTGDARQKAGAARFRAALRRFYTMGSPLDKFAYLFPDALRPWPAGAVRLMEGKGANTPRWWVNFYNALDPVSGSLGSAILCGKDEIANIYAFGGFNAWVPGLAHVSYWSSSLVLRHILGRVFGRAWLRDRPAKLQGNLIKLSMAALGFLAQAALLVALCYGLIAGAAALWNHRAQAGRWILETVTGTPHSGSRGA